MPYIGKSPVHGNFNELTDVSGSFDGSETDFALTESISSTAITPILPAALLISLNGVIQEPTTDYTVAGTNITFTTAPAATDEFFGVVMGTQLDVGTPSDSTVTPAKMNITSALVPASANGAALGSASAEWSDLYLADGGVIYFGADQEVKLTHVADTGLTLKHTATADDKPINLTLQTGETDMAADDVMGKISFQAPDEGTGTDAILVAAAIQAVSEGDFSSSSNATRLEFMTGASEAAATKMTLTSAGKLGIGVAPSHSLQVAAGADTDAMYLDVNGNLFITDGNVQITNPSGADQAALNVTQSHTSAVAANFAGPVTVEAEGGTATTNVSLGLCKAWVRTSGTAVTVSDSFNMSSVTDSGVGLYAPVINNNMSDGAYAVISSADDKQDGGAIFVHNINDAVAQATTGYGTSFKKYAYAATDANQNAASSVLGDLA
jgi:hypothetical protein